MHRLGKGRHDLCRCLREARPVVSTAILRPCAGMGRPPASADSQITVTVLYAYSRAGFAGRARPCITLRGYSTRLPLIWASVGAYTGVAISVIVVWGSAGTPDTTAGTGINGAVALGV